MVAVRSYYVGWISSILGISIAFRSNHGFLSTRQVSMRKGAAIFDSAADAEEYLAANYPECSALFAKNADVMKKIIKAEDGFTIFAPNGNAFASLGDKKRSQLDDIRNAEVSAHVVMSDIIMLCPLNSCNRCLINFVCFMLQVAEKIASYHIIIEPVTAEQLFNSGGVVTEGGTVPAERSVSGGFFGVGGKGNVMINDSICWTPFHPDSHSHIVF